MISVRERAKTAFWAALPARRVLQRGPTEHRRIALTFDDGPHALTEAYLEVLGRYQARATFFVNGEAAAASPAVMREFARGGHQVASHGYDHKRFTKLSWRQLAEQLEQAAIAIGPQPEGKWVRPPHGALDPLSVTQLLITGWTVAMWSFDARDYDGASAQMLAERCQPSAVRPGEVVLMHEGEAATLAALPMICEALVADGYQLVTMADLFRA